MKWPPGVSTANPEVDELVSQMEKKLVLEKEQHKQDTFLSELGFSHVVELMI